MLILCVAQDGILGGNSHFDPVSLNFHFAGKSWSYGSPRHLKATMEFLAK